MMYNEKSAVLESRPRVDLILERTAKILEGFRVVSNNVDNFASRLSGHVPETPVTKGPTPVPQGWYDEMSEVLSAMEAEIAIINRNLERIRG